MTRQRPTGLSGGYPRSSEPQELRRAVTEVARGLDRSILTDQSHWESIQRLESNITSMATKTDDIHRKLTDVSARLAVYTSLGGGVGAILGSIITLIIGHFIGGK